MQFIKQHIARIQAEAHALRIMKRGIKAEVLPAMGGYAVWQEEDAPMFGRLMEPEKVQEACLSEEGQTHYDTGETHALPASAVLNTNAPRNPLEHIPTEDGYAPKLPCAGVRISPSQLWDIEAAGG